MEFREQNIDFAINLLDLRYLAGDAALHSRFETSGRYSWRKMASKLGAHPAAHAAYATPNIRTLSTIASPTSKNVLEACAIWHLMGSLSHLGPERDQQRTSGLVDRPGAFLSAIRCFLHYQARVIAI